MDRQRKLIRAQKGKMMQMSRGSGTNAPSWNGGTVIKEGRVLVLSPGHPRAGQTGYVYRSLLVAEKALGYPVPPRHQVHHFDLDKSNDTNSNLVICENAAYHNLLHARQRIVDRGGDPRLVKWCPSCEQLIPRQDFHKNRSIGDGLTATCKECHKIQRGICQECGGDCHRQSTRCRSCSYLFMPSEPVRRARAK